MAYQSAISTLSTGDQARFTAERLSMLAPADRKRLEGRVGLVQGRWNHTRKLTVCFPEEGGRSELRILSVEPNQLERVSSAVTQAEVTPAPAPAPVPVPVPVATEVEPPSGGEKLSQEDMDKLFD
jgi:hypothetical protein